MNEGGDGTLPVVVYGPEQADGGIFRRAHDFADLDAAVVVQRNEVGEGPADVYA